MGFGGFGDVGSSVSTGFGVIPSAGNDAALTRFNDRLATMVLTRVLSAEVYFGTLLSNPSVEIKSPRPSLSSRYYARY